MRSLVRTVALLSSSLDMESVLERTLRAAAREMEAEAASVLLLDPETGELVVDSMRHAEDDALDDTLRRTTRGYRVPAGKGIAGHVASTGKPLNVPDAYEDPRFHPEVDRKTGMRTRAILAVPLRLQDEVIGVAEVLNRRDEKPFDREDMVLFQHFCDLAAVAIDKARLHREHLEKEALDRELAAAREIQEAFSPRALPELEGWRIGRHAVAARQVGGDFHDVVVCPGGFLGLVVGDVAGKGISAALLGASVASELRVLLKDRREAGPVVREANRIVRERSVRGMFVTLMVVALDLATGEGRWASAGHYPLLHHDEEAGEARYLHGEAGPPAGVVPEIDPPEGVFRMSPGDRLALFTDGIVEGFDPDDEAAGLEKLRLLFEEHAARQTTLEGRIVRTLTGGSAGREDDRTYLEALRVRAAG